MAICKTLFNEQRSLWNRFYFNQRRQPVYRQRNRASRNVRFSLHKYCRKHDRDSSRYYPLYDLQENDGYCVKQIIKKFENHPSIVEIKKNINVVEKFTIKEATVSDINTLLKSVNTKKATGPDNIPPKLVKLSANVIDSHLCNIINKGPQNSSFPDAAKIALVRPIYKKKCRNTIENYRPVSVLNTFSKIYERYIHNSLIPYFSKCLSAFVAAYRKCYSSSHVLIRLVEN